MTSQARRWVALCGAALAAALPVAARADEPLRHFADVSVAELVLVDTVSARHGGVVEGPDGQAEVVLEGETLGKEGLRVRRIGRGCLELAGEVAGAATVLCVDEPSAPRS